jgi:O-antigen/teichoic acid export membrane protein
LIAFLASSWVTAAYGLSRLRSLGLVGPATDRSLVWPLFTHGLRSQVATIALTLTYRSDLLLVNHFLGVSQTGVYSVALTLSEMLRVVAEAAQVLVVTQAMTDDIEHHAQAVARQSAVLTLIAGVAMGGLSGFLVPMVFGGSFAGAVKAVWCLVPGSVAVAFSYSLSPLLVLQGRVLLNGAAAMLGLGVLWTVGSWGPGAPSLVKFALASSLAYWAIAAAQVAWLWRSRHLDPANLLPTRDDIRGLMRACRLIAWRHIPAGRAGSR